MIGEKGFYRNFPDFLVVIHASVEHTLVPFHPQPWRKVSIKFSEPLFVSIHGW